MEFSLPAEAANVPLVRHALAGLAEALEMEPAEVADLKTVVTEACMNVVAPRLRRRRAGPARGRRLARRRLPDRHACATTAPGSARSPTSSSRSLRLGLPLIAALTSSFEISGAPAAAPQVTDADSARRRTAHEPTPAPRSLDETRIALPAGELLAPILSRVISMFATRADLSVDELSDAVLLSDAISASGPSGFPDGTARIAVSEQRGLVRGPGRPAGRRAAARRLLDGMRIPALDASLESARRRGPDRRRWTARRAARDPDRARRR